MRPAPDRATLVPMSHPPTRRQVLLLPPACSAFSALSAVSAVPLAAFMPGRAAAQPASAGTAGTPGTAGDAATQEAKAPPLPAPGTAFEVPAVELLDGRRFEPAMVEGRVLLLYWWASWCPFCALTSPHVDELWQAQRPRGLAMLTISIDRKPDEARAYLQRRGYAWPTTWIGAAPSRSLVKPKGLPVTLVRGRDGRVLQAEGGQMFPEDVQALARHVA
jgi:thiol-disulfide isomerase/thioredoxin